MKPGRRRRGVVIGMVALALLGIARTTGSGWAIVLFSGLMAVLAIGVAGPYLAARRWRLEVVAPADGTAGQPLRVALTVSRGRGALRLITPESDWCSVTPRTTGEVAATPVRRGIITTATVETRAGGPLGLWWVTRRRLVVLPRPLEVGPAPIPMPLPAGLRRGAGTAEPQPHAHVGHELVRSLREYRPGDPVKLVHWPATARRGEVVVRELEDPEAPSVVIVVDLRGPDEAVEAAAGRAVGLARALLAAAIPVSLSTSERGGGRIAPVAGPADAGRRLARAVAGPPPEPAAGPQVVRIAARP